MHWITKAGKSEAGGEINEKISFLFFLLNILPLVHFHSSKLPLLIQQPFSKLAGEELTTVELNCFIFLTHLMEGLFECTVPGFVNLEPPGDRSFPSNK